MLVIIPLIADCGILHIILLFLYLHNIHAAKSKVSLQSLWACGWSKESIDRYILTGFISCVVKQPTCVTVRYKLF